MANLISNASSDWTGASTWALTETGTGATQTTRSAATNTTTSYVYSAAFTGTAGSVVDGVLLYLYRGTTTGTFSVSLSEDNGTTATREVTINASDLGADPGWVFFSFGSTLTLDGGTDYKVGIKGSSAGNVAVYRDATAGNWTRLLRRTTAATAAAGDNLYIVGEWTAAATVTDITVTMDSTAATDYGTLDIGDRGILTWGTTAATNYILQLSGDLNIWGGGVYNQGTVATPMPRDSTATLQFDCASDGQFGLTVRSGGTAVLQGQSRTAGKNVDRCKLSTDESIASTSLGVDTDTGWLSGDRIAIATTTRTATQCETGTLNGNAGAAVLTVNGFGGAGGGLAFAHSGTSPTQAEVALLTRNVVIRSVSATNMAYVYIESAAMFDADWTEFRYLGENATGKRGVEIATISGVTTMDYCSFSDMEDGGLQLLSASLSGSIVISNTVVYNCASVSGTSSVLIAATSGVPVLNNTLVIRQASTSAAVALNDIGVNIDGLTVAGASGTGIATGESNANSAPWTNFCVHGCAGAGLHIPAGAVTLTNLLAWRNSSSGVNPAAAGQHRLTNVEAFGNTSQNVLISLGVVILDSPVLSGDSSFSTSTGIQLTSGLLEVINGDLSTVTGIKTAHTQDISVGANLFGMSRLINTKMGAGTEVASQANMQNDYAAITSQRHDQTDGNHKSWYRTGTLQTDATIYNTSAPSARMTPISAAAKFKSPPIVVEIDDGASKTISVPVRKSAAGDGAAYNGAQPRLIVLRNDALGIAADTVLDTMTAAAGSWETLTGTLPTPTDDGVIEVVVDCDGTTGWINYDDITVT